MLKKTLIRWMVAMFALLAVCEMALRMVLGIGHPLLIMPNKIYGYMPAPNQNLKRFFSHIRINSFGMRSENVPREKPPGTRRILFIGDSVTFGTTYVDQADIFTTRIQEDLRERATNTQVLNASSGGWAPGNELGFLQGQGTFGADLVVLVINTKDLTQPFEPFVPNLLNPTTDPPTAIGEALNRYILPRIFKNLQVHDAGSGENGEPPIDVETPKILATLSRADQFVHSHGGKFAVIFVPAAQADMKRFQEQWNKGIAMLMEWATQNNVPILDMRDSFSKKPPGEIYIDGIHLKPLGHQLIERGFMNTYQTMMDLSQKLSLLQIETAEHRRILYFPSP